MKILDQKMLSSAGLGHQGAQEAVVTALRDHSLQGGSVVLALTVSLSMAFDDAQAAALSALLTAAGPGAAAHAVLLFTHGDVSDQDRTFLPSYLDEAPAALQVHPCRSSRNSTIRVVKCRFFTRFPIHTWPLKSYKGL